MRKFAFLKIGFVTLMGLIGAFQELRGEEKESSSNVGRVKSYLLEAVQKMQKEAEDYAANADKYVAIIESHQGDYKKAFTQSGQKIRNLIQKMQDNYKGIDSFGYETVEGIVAGVGSLADFDVYLDAGVPKKEASTEAPASPLVLDLGNGKKIDQEGALFTYIMEPALWGGNAQYVLALDLDEDGKIGARESLPRIEVIKASALEAKRKIDELLAASEAWQPTAEDCFGAMVSMTPTLSGYFDDWKESRYLPESSGKFFAVSRVSDMRGIMSSVEVMYRAVHPQVSGEDKALGEAIERGFKEILSFIDRVESREKAAAGKMTVAEIDELSSQAKEKADKLVPQIEQAAALLKINLANG